MARIRTVKPEFPQSESVGRLSRDARLLFLQLFTIVDDLGRARAASRMLASLLYPYDDDAPRLIDGWLSELELGGHIRIYVIDGSTYLDIPKWLEHQKIDHPSKSKLPEFREGSRVILETFRTLAPDLGPRKGKDQERKDGASAPTELPEARFYKRVREVLGEDAGGLGKKLLKAKGSLPAAMAALEMAAGSGGARQYVGRIVSNHRDPELPDMIPR